VITGNYPSSLGIMNLCKSCRMGGAKRYPSIVYVGVRRSSAPFGSAQGIRQLSLFQRPQHGLNFGSVTPSPLSSKTTSTGMSMWTLSIGQPMTLLQKRGPSSKSIQAVT
jgi:hypothetical protein